MTGELVWRTSTHSDEIDCVEVAVTRQWTAVRDSKDRHGGHFTVSAERFQSFLSLKSGGYDT